jgi:hypothetical protein
MEELSRAFQQEDVGGRVICFLVEKLAGFDGAHEAPGSATYDDDSTGMRRVSGV